MTDDDDKLPDEAERLQAAKLAEALDGGRGGRGGKGGMSGTSGTGSKGGTGGMGGTGGTGGDGGEGEVELLAMATSIRAAAGREAPLGELRARRLARDAVAEALRRRERKRLPGRRVWLLGAALLAATVLLL